MLTIYVDQWGVNDKINVWKNLWASHPQYQVDNLNSYINLYNGFSILTLCVLNKNISFYCDFFFLLMKYNTNTHHHHRIKTISLNAKSFVKHLRSTAHVSASLRQIEDVNMFMNGTFSPKQYHPFKNVIFVQDKILEHSFFY